MLQLWENTKRLKTACNALRGVLLLPVSFSRAVFCTGRTRMTSVRAPKPSDTSSGAVHEYQHVRHVHKCLTHARVSETIECDDLRTGARERLRMKCLTAFGHTLTSYAPDLCKKPHGKSSQGAGELPPVRYTKSMHFSTKCNAKCSPIGATSLSGAVSVGISNHSTRNANAKRSGLQYSCTFEMS